MSTLISNLFLALTGTLTAHAGTTQGIIPTPVNQSVTPAAIGTGQVAISTAINNAFGGTNGIVPQIITTLTAIAGGIAVIYILIAGVQYITAGGSADKTKAARQRIISAMVGIIIIIAVYAIVRFGVGLGRLVDTTTRN